MILNFFMRQQHAINIARECSQIYPIARKEVIMANIPEALTVSCLCGSVTGLIGAAPLNVANCHCKTCRKNNGAAFNSVVLVRETDFTVLTGEKNLRNFQLGEKGIKHFCATCGTSVYNVNSAFPGIVLIPLGALDEPERCTPTLNVFCESMLSWVGAVSTLHSFPQGVPRQGGAKG